MEQTGLGRAGNRVQSRVGLHSLFTGGQMRQQLVEEGLMLFHQGGVIGFFGEVLAFECIGLVVVEFGGLCKVAEDGFVRAEIGGPPFDVAVTRRADGPAHRPVFPSSMTHLGESGFVESNAITTHQWNQTLTLDVPRNRQTGQFAERRIHIEKLGQGSDPFATGDTRERK